MKTKIYLMVGILLFGLLAVPLTDIGFGSPPRLGAEDAGAGQEKPFQKRVLIGFKDGSGRQAAERHQSSVRALGGDVHHSFHLLPVVSAKLPQKMIAEMKSLAEIAYIEDDVVMHTVQQETPWGVDRIDADQVWPTTNTGAGVDVAILDTGIDYDHPDLDNNIAGGVNYAGWRWRDGSTNKFYWNDIYGHGSYCAGIVAAENNTVGVVGVAPGARLWAVKVLDDTGNGYVSDIIQGLEWCSDHGIEIASMSFGGDYSESLENACSAAYAAGVLLVAAAGNEGASGVLYPAGYDSVIAVSATDSSDAIASFSSVGPQVELAAPGVAVKSTYKNGGYALGDGTSMACPHVAGVAALVRAAPKLGLTTPAQIRLRLRETAEDLGLPAIQQGYGLVDAQAAATAGDIHDVAVVAIAAPSAVTVGAAATINVTIQNQGTVSETFNVVLTESPGGFTNTKTITMAAGDTTGATPTDHTITVTAGPVPNETDTADNSRSAVIAVDLALTDIAVTAVNAPSSVVQGETVHVSVTVRNVGNQDIVNSIVLTLSDDTDATTIGSQTIIGGLSAGALTTLNFTWNTSGASIGDHTLTAKHGFTDGNAGNNSLSTVVTVEQEQAAPTIHVGDITFKADVWSIGTWSSWCRVTVTVPVLDNSDVAIGGATVYGSWSGAYNRTVSGSTDSQGKVSFGTSFVVGGGTFIFTVNNVTKAGWTYDPAANLETSDSVTVP
jgi:subtilisin